MKSPRLPGWALVLVLVACGGNAETTTTTTTAPVITAPTTTAAATTTTPAAVVAPWSAAPLTAEEAPGALTTAWQAAENQATCPALAPMGGITGAEPRVATYAGGWGVAWDAPDGPGMAADGTFCEDCGRSAVGVAGAGIAADETVIRSWPNVTDYVDGSVVGFGPEGSISGAVEAPQTVEGNSPTQLAYLMLAGQECLYNVWSRRSEVELLAVISSLRFVEGLGAPLAP